MFGSLGGNVLEYNRVLRILFKSVLQEFKVNLDDDVLCWFKSGTDLRLPSSEYALLRGKEILLTCRYYRGVGQVFTVAPRSFRGKLKDVLNLDLDYLGNVSVLHGVMNAVLKHLGLISKSEHCVEREPELCGYALYDEIISHYGQNVRVLHVGYQPGHIKVLAKFLRDNLVVTDLDESLVWRTKHGRLVVDGSLNKYLIAHVDVILLTASSIANNTAWDILNHAKILGKEVIVYGVSASAAIQLLRSKGVINVRHFCPYAK